MGPRIPGDEMMKIYSAYNDDGLTVTVIAKSAKDAADKTAEAIAQIGLDIDPAFFEDDIDNAYISDDTNVSEWLASQGIELTSHNLIVTEWNAIDQSANVYEL